MFYGWYFVAACCLISFYVTGIVSFGLTAFVEPLSNEFGWSYTQISLASSIRGLEVGLFVPVAGMLMDRWGPRRLIFCGAILMGLGCMAMSRADSLFGFYVSMVIIATGLSTMPSTLLMAAAANWFRRRAGLAMGITASGVALAGLLVPVITLMVEQYGWRQAMVYSAVGMWLIPLPLSLALRHRPEDIGLCPDGEKRCTVSGDASTTAWPLEASAGAREALSSRPFWVISLTSLIVVLPISALSTHIMPYLGTVGIGRLEAGIIAGATPLLTIVGRIGCGWAGDSLDKRTVMALALVSMAAGLLLLPMISVDRRWLIAAFVILYGIGWGGTVPMISGLLRTYFGLRRLATIMGFSGSVMFAGLVAGAPIAGWVFDRWERYEPVWYAMAALIAVAAFLFRVLLDAPPGHGARAAKPL